MISVEKIQLVDLEQIRFLQPEGWTDIVTEFEMYLREAFCFPIKVTAEGQMVGIGAAIALGSTGWLAHIIVDPAQRKKGIGMLIVEELLRILRGQGVRTFLLIATEIGKPVYLRADFRIVTEYVFHKRESAWQGYPMSGNIISYIEIFHDDILSLDRKVTGENREGLLKDKIKHASLYVKDYSLEGFYIPGLGEGPIIAMTTEAGLELMKLKYATLCKAVLPSENRAGLDFLLSNGFSVTAVRGTRMILGEEIPWEPEKIFSRIAGNVG